MSSPRWIPLLLPLLWLAVAPAQEPAAWPGPGEAWWEELTPGQRATYRLVSGGIELQRAIEVEGREGSLVTVSTCLLLDGDRLPKYTRTAEAGELVEGPPRGYRIQRLRDEAINLAGRDWPCVVYQLTRGDETLTVWHAAPALPELFAGGNVKVERKQGAETSTVELVEFR